MHGYSANAPANVAVYDSCSYEGKCSMLNRGVMQGYPGQPTLAALVTNTASLSTLLTALKVANVAAAFANPNEIATVFAPSNDAFASLPAGVLDSLVKNPAELRKVLGRHVVRGTYDSKAVAALIKAKKPLYTIWGDPLYFGADASGRIFVRSPLGTAEIIMADVKASNGVAHVINSVL